MEAYLDYNATTPLDPKIQTLLSEKMSTLFANPSSFHQKGQAARNAVEAAREELASELSVEPGDLLFTSGGTESNNLALKGAAATQKDKGRDGVVLSSVEHQSILHPAKFLASMGYRVTVVDVDDKGRIDLEKLKSVIDDKTAIVSLMHANNEVGTLQPIEEVCRLAHSKGALFHTDMVQSFGKYHIDLDKISVDLASFSAHKIYGPKGVGAIYIKKGVKIKSIQQGGHQEKNIRPGTENVLGILGMGEAVKLAKGQRKADYERILKLRDKLESAILSSIPGAEVNGDTNNRLFNTCNVSFPRLDGETLLMNLDLDHIYVSTGSACTAGSVEPSHVLLAMGLGEAKARGTIRFSLGRFSTEKEVEYVLDKLPGIVTRLQKNFTGHKK